MLNRPAGTATALGPVMLDVVGTELTADDLRRIRHPLTGGVILFSRKLPRLPRRSMRRAREF
jgi:beta-glucosidase-like glycosyl hydrolase